MNYDPGVLLRLGAGLLRRRRPGGLKGMMEMFRSWRRLTMSLSVATGLS